MTTLVYLLAQHTLYFEVQHSDHRWQDFQSIKTLIKEALKKVKLFLLIGALLEKTRPGVNKVKPKGWFTPYRLTMEQGLTVPSGPYLHGRTAFFWLDK